jgi:hypothetical protein
MLVAPDSSFVWADAALLFAAVLVSAFLVTWLITDVGHVRRTPYIGILTALALGLFAADLVWSGTNVADLVTPNWPWAIVGGLVVAAITALATVPRTMRIGMAAKMRNAELTRSRVRSG